jgi:hypothetical protein
MSEKEREFAFGASEVTKEHDWQKCQCPAATAGLDPLCTASTEIVGRYDDAFHPEMGHDGFVHESVARNKWLTALNEMREENATDIYIEFAEDVAEELGWL